MLRSWLGRLCACVLLAVCPACAQVQAVAAPRDFAHLPLHPLSWWTRNPLRLDASGDMMIGIKTPDGRTVTAADYRVERQVTQVGRVAGWQIVQIILTIQAGPRIVAAGWASADSSTSQWKILLVGRRGQAGFREIYDLQGERGTYEPFASALLYGAGRDLILGTYDPVAGNGGECSDGYWWFDREGVRPVNFSPLLRAVGRSVPANSTYTSNCWALHPEREELRSVVQSRDAVCHACGILGSVSATYEIRRGVAIPVSVRFEPEATEK